MKEFHVSFRVPAEKFDTAMTAIDLIQGATHVVARRVEVDEVVVEAPAQIKLPAPPEPAREPEKQPDDPPPAERPKRVHVGGRYTVGAASDNSRSLIEQTLKIIVDAGGEISERDMMLALYEVGRSPSSLSGTMTKLRRDGRAHMADGRILRVGPLPE